MGGETEERTMHEVSDVVDIPPTVGGNDDTTVAVPEPSWADIEKLTAQADVIATEEPLLKSKKRKAAEALNESGTAVQKIETPVDTMVDPVKRKSVVRLVNISINFVRDTFDYTDPEPDWREEVGELSARLLMPYLKAGEMSDGIMLCTLVAIWLAAGKKKTDVPKA